MKILNAKNAIRIAYNARRGNVMFVNKELIFLKKNIAKIVINLVFNVPED